MENTAVKWQLANDANDEELYRAAQSEMIGHLSDENKEEYLKNAVPLSEYIEAKDTYDYNNGNYTTTKYLNTQPDEKVKQIQNQLNVMGYTDKFGNPLKEDGIAGSKTLYAFDKFDENTGSNNKNQSNQPYMKENVPLYSDELFKNATLLNTSDNGKLSKGDEKRNKVKQTMIKCLSSNWYANKGNSENQEKIHNQAEKLRKFDDNNFCKAYLLNSSTSAGIPPITAGHSAVMLMNTSGEALVFSFYPTEENPFKTLKTDGEMRFSVLTNNQAKDALNGKNIYSMSASDGDIKTERYDRYKEYNIESGYNMYNHAVDLYDNPDKYKLLFRQCDDVAVEILRKGGIDIESKLWPNRTYEKTK